MRWLLLALALLGAGDAYAAACTDGTDCYCDCVNGPATIGSDPTDYKNTACQTKLIPVDGSVLVCEDFEAITLWDGRGTGTLGQTGGSGGTACTYANGDAANCFGAGAPLYGPWYDHTGAVSGFRGKNGYWSRTYGPPSGGCCWTDAEPAGATLGTACNVSGLPCDYPEWSSGDPWGAPHLRTCVDIMRDGEFDDEIATNAEPTFPGSMGGSGSFDGKQIMAHRVPEGDGNANGSAGFHGGKAFGHAVTEIGYTEALAYPSDILASDVWDSPWKDNQFQGGTEHWHRGSTGAGTKPDDLPYMPFRFGNCAAAMAVATVHVGTYVCNGDGLAIGPGSAYAQATDFPFGTWGCTQAYMSGMDTSNMTWKVWHNGALIIHLSGVDGTELTHQSYSNFSWNNYANHNQFVGQKTTQTTYRYADNVHIREGEPVSCEQIGFSFAAGPDGGDLALSASTYSQTEGTGAGTTNIAVNVVRTGTLTEAVGATVSTTAGTATAGGTDYTGTSQNVSFGAGSSVCTGCPVNFAVNRDALDEDNETFTVTLGSATGGATLISPTTATATITDDDAAPSVVLSVDNTTIAEAAGVATLTATLSAASGLTVTTNLAFTGTATGGGVDYTASGSSIAISAGGTTGTRTLTAVADATDEPTNLTIITDISGVTNGTESGTQQQTVTILDDDNSVGLGGGSSGGLLPLSR